MRKILVYLFALFLAINFTSCSKDGTAGPEGKQGVPGIDGQMIYHKDLAPGTSTGKVGDY